MASSRGRVCLPPVVFPDSIVECTGSSGFREESDVTWVNCAKLYAVVRVFMIVAVTFRYPPACARHGAVRSGPNYLVIDGDPGLFLKLKFRVIETEKTLILGR